MKRKSKENEFGVHYGGSKIHFSFKINRRFPKFAQIHEKTPHKKFQLNRLRIGRVNLRLSFRGVLVAFLGKRSIISRVLQPPHKFENFIVANSTLA